MIIDVIDLGLIEYEEAYKFQKRQLKSCQTETVNDTLILCQHPPVFTIGRAGSKDNIKVPEEVYTKRGIKVICIDRGGDITYHGPGQLIAYPIFNLQNYGKDVHAFLRNLEEVGILFLSEFGVSAGRKQDYTGVWVKGDKIASIGIGVSRWVSFHGLALNIRAEKENFSMINPCGLKGVKIISLSELIIPLRRTDKPDSCGLDRQNYKNPDKKVQLQSACELEYENLKEILIRCFERVFNVSCCKKGFRQDKEISAVA